MTGGMTGGHFIGFYLAILGLALLVVFSTRPRVIRRLGSKRLPLMFGAIVMLVCVALFGSGTREIFFRTVVGPKDEVLPRIEQTHVDAALAEILRPEFVQYMVRLDGTAPFDAADRIQKALSVRVGTTVDLMALGYQFDPPPKLGQTYFFVSYDDRENALLAIFRGDAGIRRLKLAERMVTRVLPQAAAIVALRNAQSDEEKIAILHENPFVMPYPAEWLLVELGKLSKNASLPLVLEIAQKRAYIQQYVENPKLRDVEAEVRVGPP